MTKVDESRRLWHDDVKDANIPTSRRRLRLIIVIDLWQTKAKSVSEMVKES